MSCGPCSCTITIDNGTGHHLKLLGHDLPWGKFQRGPEKNIMPRTSQVAFVASQNIGPAGTEGTVWYQLGDDANKTISIYFDVPTRPFSDNKVQVDTSGDPNLSAALSGFNGKQSDERCTVRVVWAG
jgi:hypothetical protein